MVDADPPSHHSPSRTTHTVSVVCLKSCGQGAKVSSKCRIVPRKIIFHRNQETLNVFTSHPHALLSFFVIKLHSDSLRNRLNSLLDLRERPTSTPHTSVSRLLHRTRRPGLRQRPAPPFKYEAKVLGTASVSYPGVHTRAADIFMPTTHSHVYFDSK